VTCLVHGPAAQIAVFLPSDCVLLFWGACDVSQSRLDRLAANSYCPARDIFSLPAVLLRHRCSSQRVIFQRTTAAVGLDERHL
jgi:hypothetical protein